MAGQYYTSLFPEKISTLVSSAAPIDMAAEPSEIIEGAKMPMALFEDMVASTNGLMPGEYILTGFKSMQPEKHYRFNCDEYRGEPELV